MPKNFSRVAADSSIYLSVIAAVVLTFGSAHAARVDFSDPHYFIRAGAASLHPRFVKDEILVTYKESVGASNIVSRRATVASRLRAVSRGMLSARLEHLKLPRELPVESALTEALKDPGVEKAQPNYIYQAAAVPSDPNYNQSWAFKNNSQNLTLGDYSTANPGTNGDDLNLEKTWDVITDCSSVPVAVVDSGITYDHEDLVNSLWDGGSTYPNHGYNFVDGNNDPRDLNGHGTHVAGIIGANANNGRGGVGVCWKANIMALRALDAAGAGTTASLTSALAAAISVGAKIINLSLVTSENDPAIESAITSVNNAGILLVVAAGNSGQDLGQTPAYPCSYALDDMLCVAALDQSYGLATFSNTGTSAVNIAAPGVNILSTFAGTETDQAISLTNGSGWTTVHAGWSFATPTLSTTSGQKAMPMIVNPASWNGSTTFYTNNEDARIYRTLNLSGQTSAHVSISGFYDMDASDSFNVAYSTTGGDPFTSAGTFLDQLTGTSGDSGFKNNYDLTPCLTSACTVGLQIVSDASKTNYGVGIYGVDLTTLALDTSSYKYLDGTSMATPFITGIAALVWAKNPSYKASDVALAIKSGGRTAPSLNGKTTNGVAADAYGAVSYIAAPANFQASVE